GEVAVERVPHGAPPPPAGVPQHIAQLAVQRVAMATGTRNVTALPRSEPSHRIDIDRSVELPLQFGACVHVVPFSRWSALSRSWWSTAGSAGLSLWPAAPDGGCRSEGGGGLFRALRRDVAGPAASHPGVVRAGCGPA